MEKVQILEEKNSPYEEVKTQDPPVIPIDTKTGDALSLLDQSKIDLENIGYHITQNEEDGFLKFLEINKNK